MSHTVSCHRGPERRRDVILTDDLGELPGSMFSSQSGPVNQSDLKSISPRNLSESWGEPDCSSGLPEKYVAARACRKAMTVGIQSLAGK